jgi:hypothetical protein
MDKLTGKEAQGFVGKFEALFKGLPHLPKGIVDFIVSISPWLAGLGGIGAVYGGLTGLFFSQRRGAMWQYVRAYSGIGNGYFVATSIFSLLTGALLLMAFTPLKNRKLSGWMFLFWANILGLIQSAVSLVFGYGGLVGMLVSAAFGFYVLFEVKKSYK